MRRASVVGQPQASAQARSRSLAVSIATILVVIPALGAANPPQVTPDTAGDCVLCSENLQVPVVRLSTAWLDSLAQQRARFNARQIGLLDSLLSNGHFGKPREKVARRQVHMLARLTTINAYRDLILLASDSTIVYEADETILRELYAQYTDVSLFSAARLARVRLGLGRACLRYTVGEEAEGESIHGGRVMRWRVADTRIDGEVRRLLQLDLPTATDDVVKVLLAPHHSFEVEYRRVEGPPSPYEWFIVHNIEGGWLRKWGTHRPTAYMFWVSPRGSGVESLTTLPSMPLAGVRVYIPHLKLRMPLLPDVGLDDLREIELPMPILAMDYLEENQKPRWLGRSKLGFKDWKGFGPVPPDVRRRFPDL